MIGSGLLLALGALGAGGGGQSPVQGCDVLAARGVDPGLGCVALVAVPDLPDASGYVELLPAPTPFGTAVDADGRHRRSARITLAGLPAPETLGPYRAYVAWATTPTLSPVIRLGPVGNGTRAAGGFALNTFMIWISAEADSAVTQRRGRLVLRGRSPSSLLEPHAVSLFGGAADEADHHSAPDDGWRMPPHHPAAPEPMPGIDRLRPRGVPFRPGADIDPASLPPAVPARVLDLADGDSLALDARLVRRTIGGRSFVMYGFNGEYPGPFIRVPQGATIVIGFTNRLDLPTAVHWHGVRLDNRFDGVPHVTQDPVPPGGQFRYVVRFPDAGVYWYHPHHREDIQQDLGLYGNLLVRPASAEFYGPAHREEPLLLDDLLLDERGPLPHGRDHATHALMGRFGNLHLVNGEPSYRLTVRRGEVVRFLFTNAANSRTYNVHLEGARVKAVATDLGRFLREEWVESVALAPAERYVVHARFPSPGTYAITNRVQGILQAAGAFLAEVDTLGLIEVLPEAAAPDLAASHDVLRTDPGMAADLDRLRPHLERPPDHTLELSLEVRHLPFALERIMRLDTAYVNPVEWSGTMPMMDWLPTGAEVEWLLREPATGRRNEAIDWRFRVGEMVKLRLVNDRHTLHPMQHPIHLHGQRFLVVARNGEPVANLGWKDTVLLPVGTSADILVEMSNPGRWMLHCHIAEHLEAGMRLVLTVHD